ncbi:hypothetical protein NEOC65_000657 [Neochlamydia sp. AcF65]|nr:hypothetical protein [Neochlamydia sp. AcF65]
MAKRFFLKLKKLNNVGFKACMQGLKLYCKYFYH